ncbi:3-hydroxyacyl-ACP dehydratase FabZ [Staphylococcus pseudintermedius]|uniref:3-hydroxyacyl-ACP dehydratase FabZ n=1 Tax=Staphylococcus pseudintermedius TaxID=283734 RepID=UPI002883955B|nr:3-hydroxyacyl-ACP dehydratase FabZ [Staphylococcus pseudintermedius]MDT0977466.1 3-hydroxyacyl-ACP dehydratase FabZ [Staphylococcus pseudintermedius]
METIFNYNEIKNIIPHRQPFLLIDKVVEYEPGQRCVGIKQVSGNEPFFQGHFPDYAVMPGILITEALAQTGAVAMLNSEENKGKLALFAGIDKCRFKKQVVPGDTLVLEVEITKIKGPIGKGTAKATVDGQIACSCELTFALQDPNA